MHLRPVAWPAGLLCLRTAKQGGKSCWASSATIHNRMLDDNPELLRRLYEPSYLDRKNEIPEGKLPWFVLPVFNQHQVGTLASQHLAWWQVLRDHRWLASCWKCHSCSILAGVFVVSSRAADGQCGNDHLCSACCSLQQTVSLKAVRQPGTPSCLQQAAGRPCPRLPSLR